MPEPDQPLPVALEPLWVEHLDGDLRGRVPLAHGAVDDPSVDDAEAALADDLPRVEVAGGLPELVVREELEAAVRRHGPELLHVLGYGQHQHPLRPHLPELRRGRRRPRGLICVARSGTQIIYISSMDAKRRTESRPTPLRSGTQVRLRTYLDGGTTTTTGAAGGCRRS